MFCRLLTDVIYTFFLSVLLSMQSAYINKHWESDKHEGLLFVPNFFYLGLSFCLWGSMCFMYHLGCLLSGILHAGLQFGEATIAFLDSIFITHASIG